MDRIFWVRPGPPWRVGFWRQRLFGGGGFIAIDLGYRRLGFWYKRKES